MDEQTEFKDWRGIPITVGSTVVYGATVGRSVALVEAEVSGFTPSGRIRVKIIRRAYGSTWASSKPQVDVGADRVTVVTELPPSDLPLHSEKVQERKDQEEAYKAKQEALIKEAVDKGMVTTTYPNIYGSFSHNECEEKDQFRTYRYPYTTEERPKAHFSKYDCARCFLEQK